MTDLNTLPEVIAKDQFLFLLEELLQNHDQRAVAELIMGLELLGEKFEKFYDPDVIAPAQRVAIFKLLKSATDTRQVKFMEHLTGIMFQYRIDAYARYLEELLYTITTPEGYREVYEAINEYKGSNSNTPH